MPRASRRSLGLMGENSTPMRTWLGPGASGSGTSTYSRPSTGLPKAVSWTARMLISPLNLVWPRFRSTRRLSDRSRAEGRPSRGKFVPEHGPPALRRLSRRLVLDDVPMLGDQAVFDTHDVDHDPVHWLPDP